jgi:hypothetical protein
MKSPPISQYQGKSALLINGYTRSSTGVVMDLEAMAVTVIFSLILGIVLFIPGWLWCRWRIGKQPTGQAGHSVTGAGYLFFGTLTVVLVVGFVLGRLEPKSALGSLVSTQVGRLIYIFIVVAVFWPIDRILKSKGIHLTRPREPH